jgi:hypothetical protein
MWSETLEGDIEQFEADLALNVVEYHCEKRHRPEYAKRIVNVLRGLAEQIESVELQMARDGHK